MTLSMELWQINDEKLIPSEKASLDLEKRLENWIEKDLNIIGYDAMIIGRQVPTGYGGYIDLLALNSDGDLLIVELKRSKTPRDIVCQCLDYGTWVNDLGFEAITGIYENYKSGRSLEKDFVENFDATFPEKINNDYQIVIVAESVDDSTERIVKHLNEIHGVNINVVFFNVFLIDGNEVIGRSYLKDPTDVEEKSSARKKSKWTGFYFVNTGITDSNARSWDLNKKHAFVSAAGARWLNMIKKLKKGDKIFAFIKGAGYVGYGIVEEEAVFVKNYKYNDQLITEDLPDDHPWKTANNPSREEWLVKVNWLKTYDEDSALWFKGAFANQNVVCKLRDQNTFRFLSEKFEVEELQP